MFKCGEFAVVNLPNIESWDSTIVCVKNIIMMEEYFVYVVEVTSTNGYRSAIGTGVYVGQTATLTQEALQKISH